MIRAVWRDGLIYAFGGVLARGIGLITLPLLVRSLTPSEYGALELITTIGVLVNLVLPLEISQGLARYWNERTGEDARRRLAGTAWTFTLASQAAFVACCWLGSRPIALALFGDELFAPAVRTGGCAIALNNAFYLLQNQFRWQLRPVGYAKATLFYAFANLVLVVLFVATLDGGLEAVLLAQSISAALACGFCLIGLRNSLALGIARKDLVEMLLFSLPLVPAGIAVFATLYSNRLMLNAESTLQDVGVFALANRLSSIVTLALVGIQAVTPWVYKHHRDSGAPAQLARLLEGFCAVALTACLALGLFASELILFFATPDYLDAAPLVFWLAGAALLAQLYVFTPGIAIGKKTFWQLAITLMSGSAAIILNLALIPRFGLMGATVATLVAATLFFGAWAICSQRLYPLPVRRAPIATGVGLFVLLGLFSPMLDAAMPPGLGRSVIKVAILLAFAGAMVALGLIQWQRLERMLPHRQ
jgi:O-antigen/teichoic acid export membrane protein